MTKYILGILSLVVALPAYAGFWEKDPIAKPIAQQALSRSEQVYLTASNALRLAKLHRDQLKVVNQRLAALEAQVGTLRADVSNMQATVIEMQGAIGDLQTVVSGMQVAMVRQVRVTPITYTGTTIATDASLGKMFTVALTNNAFLDTPINLIDGQTLEWSVTQVAGSNTLSVSTNFVFPSGISNLVCSTGVGACDVIIAQYCAGINKLRITGFLKFDR